MYKLNNREVEITEAEYDDGMVQVLEASYVDNSAPLSQDEMLLLENRYQDELAQEAYEASIDAAEHYMNMER